MTGQSVLLRLSTAIALCWTAPNFRFGEYFCLRRGEEDELGLLQVALLHRVGKRREVASPGEFHVFSHDCMWLSYYTTTKISPVVLRSQVPECPAKYYGNDWMKCK